MDTDSKLRRPLPRLGARRTNRSAVIGLLTAPLVLLTTACGSDSNDKIGFHFSGKPQPGIPSRVAWDAHLEMEIGNFLFDSGTAVLTPQYSVNRIAALDTTSGAVRFDDEHDALPPDLDGVLAFSAGRVLIGAHENGATSIENSRIDTFDAATGKKLWSVPLDLQDPLPLVVGDAVVVANHDAGQSIGHVHLYALADGKERWSAPLSIAPVAKPESNDHDRGAPLLADDGSTLTVQTGSGTSLAQIDIKTGAITWEHDTGRPIVKVQPVETKARVLVLTKAADKTDLTLRIEGLNIDTGDSVWSEQSAYPTFVVNGDDVVVATGFGGTWSAFDIASGSKHWSSYGDGSTILAVSGQFAVTDGLSVFDLKTGEHAWGTSKFQTPGDVHVVGDVVLADSASHKPTAYDLATGDKLWALTDGFVVKVLDQSATVLTQNVDVLELHDLRTGAVLWTLSVGDKIGVRADTDADGNLYVFLDKYRKSVATIVAIKPPTA